MKFKHFLLCFLLLFVKDDALASELPEFPSLPTGIFDAIFWDTEANNFVLLMGSSSAYLTFLGTAETYEGSGVYEYHHYYGNYSYITRGTLSYYQMSSDGQTWQYVGNSSTYFVDPTISKLLVNGSEIRHYTPDVLVALTYRNMGNYTDITTGVHVDTSYYVTYQIMWRQIYWYNETPDWLPETGTNPDGDSDGNYDGLLGLLEQYYKDFFALIYQVLEFLVSLPGLLMEELGNLLVYLFVPDFDKVKEQFVNLLVGIGDRFPLSRVLASLEALKNIDQVSYDYNVTIQLFGETHVIPLLNRDIVKYLVVNMQAFVVVYVYIRLFFYNGSKIIAIFSDEGYTVHDQTIQE